MRYERKRETNSTTWFRGKEMEKTVAVILQRGENGKEIYFEGEIRSLLLGYVKFEIPTRYSR